VSYEMKNDTATIWVNDRKTEEAHADRTGSALIDGVEYWVNGYLRRTKNNKPYLALSFRRKNADTAVDKSRSLAEDLNDSIGF
jgi:hypothetical protein